MNDCSISIDLKWCGQKRSVNMQIDKPQVIDRSIEMIFVNGSSLTNMEVGQRKSFIVTNEIHNFDAFWKTGVCAMVILGFIAYNFGFREGGRVA